MAVAQAYDGFCTFKKESTFGSDPGGTRDIHCRVVRDTLKKTKNFQVMPGMAGPGVRQRYAGNTVVAGDLELEFHYSALPQLMMWTCGPTGYTFTADGGGGTGAHQHLIKPSTDQMLDSFSLELARGNIPSGKVFLYTGCTINQLLLEWANQTVVKFVLSIIAQEETPNTTAVETFSPASDVPVFWHNVAAPTVAGVTGIPMKSGTFVINNNMQGDRFLMSKTISQPNRADYRTVTGTVVSEFDGVDEYTAWNAETESSLLLQATSEAVITGAINYSLSIIAASGVQFETVETALPGNPGPIDLPLAWHVNGAYDEVSITAINGDTTYA